MNQNEHLSIYTIIHFRRISLKSIIITSRLNITKNSACNNSCKYAAAGNLFKTQMSGKSFRTYLG